VLTRRKKIVFALAAIGLACAGMLVLLLGVDLYLHHRAERSAGLNRWGYRGPVAPRKQPGEVRVVMLGGSTTFGYGVRSHESIPAVLEDSLRASEGGAKFRAINLGFNNEGAYASVPTLQDYAWLDYDIVALYHGYNDLLGDAAVNTAVFRHESPVFRLTGYFPILPLALQEKAMALRSGGNLDAAYKSARDGAVPGVTFSPNMAQRTSATALEALSTATAALGKQLDRVSARAAPVQAVSEAGCEPPWIRFCDSIYRAVKHSRAGGAGVLVIAQPTGKGFDRLDDQRRQLEAMLARQFGGDRGTMFVDLSRAVDPADPKTSFDGLHLGVEGNGVIARALVEPVITLTRSLGK
jgi:lysophospholipase L1-like esterase